jgi:hypothetical protein
MAKRDGDDTMPPLITPPKGATRFGLAKLWQGRWERCSLYAAGTVADRWEVADGPPTLPWVGERWGRGTYRIHWFAGSTTKGISRQVRIDVPSLPDLAPYPNSPAPPADPAALRAAGLAGTAAVATSAQEGILALVMQALGGAGAGGLDAGELVKLAMRDADARAARAQTEAQARVAEMEARYRAELEVERQRMEWRIAEEERRARYREREADAFHRTQLELVRQRRRGDDDDDDELDTLRTELAAARAATAPQSTGQRFEAALADAITASGGDAIKALLDIGKALSAGKADKPPNGTP